MKVLVSCEIHPQKKSWKKPPKAVVGVVVVHLSFIYRKGGTVVSEHENEL